MDIRVNDEPDERKLTTADLAGGQREDVPGSAQGAKMVREEPTAPLFPSDETGQLRSRWDSVQAKFVDEPRKAVEEADQLVASTMKRLAEIFSGERDALEKQWSRGDNISTEDLRQALRRYRSFFDRLLSV